MKKLGYTTKEALGAFNEKTKVPHETQHDEPAMFDGEEKEEVKKKERKPNTIYTLKAFKAYINKIEEQKLLTNEEMKQLRHLHRVMTNRWIGLEIENQD